VLLIIDNYDSFTHNLIDYFDQLGEVSGLIRNDLSRSEWPDSPDAIVISPGPMDPQRAGNLMEMIDYYHDRVPFLGICLWHQALGVFFGAKLDYAIKPMHGKISRIRHSDSTLFKNLPESFEVVRYHSLVLKNLPSELLPLAYTEDKELMAFRHRFLPVYGIQFHPAAAAPEHGVD
jgi:anthranilate synthase component 2